MIERRLRNIVISGYGVKVSRKDELIRISPKEGNPVQVSPREVEQVIIAGEASITIGVIRLLQKNGVDLVFVEHDPANFFARVVRSDYNMVTDVWRKQILMDKGKRLAIAKEIMDCAIYNKLRILQSLAKNRAVDFDSFDLIEEFRQPIVDRVVITQITQHQVRADEFDQREDMCYMSERVRRMFLDALYQRFEVEYAVHGERLEFLDIIFEQAKLLAKAIGNNERYGGFRYR